MPDLAVESWLRPARPSVAHLRRKVQAPTCAEWHEPRVDRPADLKRGVDVCRSADGARLDIEFIGADGLLSGEDALPGFELELSRLFPHPETNSDDARSRS